MANPAQRASLLTALMLVGAPGCGGDEGGGEAAGESAAGSTGEDEAEAETGEITAAPGDSCDAAVLVKAPTTFTSSLRHATPSILDPGFAASCGATGPVVYLRLELEARADLTIHARGRAFTPRLAVLLPGCVSAQADPDRLLGCVVGPVPQTFMDMGPGAELLLTVGIPDGDPALELPAAAAGEPDPLDFELEVELRAVLDEGQACGSGQGRCASGTVCLVSEEDGFEVERCHRPPADSCVAPGQLALPEPGAGIEITIEPEEPHSDAHEHTCTGWRRPDRVEQLMLPATLPDGAALVVRADDPRVGLALRDSSCLPELELSCSPAIPTAMQTLLTWGGNGELSALAATGDAPLLFIELPRADTETDPIEAISVSVEIASN
ncbi:hypothetical protein DB30_07553 [Enhygromyxa salina]|uniref:Uncharacterized protein n=1 Tax=Enhygromyxa salina TaxID=215803 RepID=A0A0C2D0Q9_9BACT|nr:hypothetical protein [Enhygromyxa salina]KIG13707.1 hypothetical protein DB30_07553 [Enhygromyxa salina]